MDKLVSIILPIYNQEKYLDISIPAVIEQEYRNIQIILVNDGSADSSLEIINKYAARESRITVIDKKNGGLVDATVAGVNAATGDYICFLDPDDTIGTDFIKNFIDAIGDCDAIAAGFYRDNKGKFLPLFLDEDRIYLDDDLVECRRNIFFDEEGKRRDNRLYISRWNKMYKRDLVLKFIDVFSKYKNVSLGEDSIFTYLVLLNAHKIKALRFANSYYYNIGNQSSMMKTGAVDLHLKKSSIAYDTMSKLESDIGDSNRQAYILYFLLVESVFRRVFTQDDVEFQKLYYSLGKDQVYQKAMNIMKSCQDKKLARVCYLRSIIKKSRHYRIVINSMTSCISAIREAKFILQNNRSFLKDTISKGYFRAKSLKKFRVDRHEAFGDLEKYLPLLETRITEILTPFLDKQTDFSECPIEKNVFVFWWDGFDNAPVVVKKCLESIIKAHSDCRIIQITKHNYKDYTDIDPLIVSDYLAGKISVQTFSDILRFNLLKNNGGVWIDATIYFEKEYNLIEKLSNKSIESVSFSSTEDFLKYKNMVCSWSGYFFASRKNSVFTQAMDTIFREYYLKYKTYNIYFFIDAALMICKINGIDGNALNKIHRNRSDMALLVKLFNEPYNKAYRNHISLIPQKLNWNFKGSAKKDSVYAVMMHE
jgi:glycosyltransferase involved in cell wall biosynthesis